MTIAPVAGPNNPSRYRTALNELIGNQPLSAAPVLRPGISGQVRAGRALALADFTTLLGLSAPVALYGLGTVNDASGNARNLSNKGTVTFGAGITAAATEAAIFTGATAQALYVASASAAPFSITTGSWACWFKTSKRSTLQTMVSKWATAGSLTAYRLCVDSTNVIRASGVITGGTEVAALGTTDVADGRWHFACAVHDGATLRVYVDGVLEASAALVGPLAALTVPFNIGGEAADASTAAVNPHYGRIDEALVTADVLSLDQIRCLYAAAIPHTAAAVPTRIDLAVRRRRRGGPLVTGDFPATPKRLYNFTAGALTDAGSDNVPLAVSSGAVTTVAGADGGASGGVSFTGTNMLACSDSGLTAGSHARTVGAWMRRSDTTGLIGMQAGTATTNKAIAVGITISGGGTYPGSAYVQDASTSVVVDGNLNDGAWHHVVAVTDPAAADGLKTKLYIDGKVAGGSTTEVGAGFTSAGAAGFEALSNGSGTRGALDGLFFAESAYTPEQIQALYAKGSQAMPPSPKDPGAHIEAVDATNVYAVFDTLDSQNTVDLQVAA